VPRRFGWWVFLTTEDPPAKAVFSTNKQEP